MHLIRNKYAGITRIICFVFALHILNMSIDPRDPQPDSVPEDLTINEIESITEFFAEVVFGIKNAFAEHDERDANDSGTLDLCKIFFITQQAAQPAEVPGRIVVTLFSIYTEAVPSQLVRDIIPPPPKV